LENIFQLLDKSLAGTYRLALLSREGLENEVLFSLPLLGLERCDWKNFSGMVSSLILESQNILKLKI
jgi:hypothetical protein